MAGHEPELWDTKAYTATLIDNNHGLHKAICFEVDTITSSVARVNITPVVHLFSGQNLKEKEVRRPIGEVNFLLGNDMAGIHPTVGKEDVSGNLRLLHSRFGSGRLLSGTHKLISPKPVQINAMAYKLTHATITPSSGGLSTSLLLNHITTIPSEGKVKV